MPEPQSAVLAHVAQDRDGCWRQHDLGDHLAGTARVAAAFATPFASESWAELAARLHDLGKAGADFQRYLRTASGYDAEAHLEGKHGKVDHSSAGAVWAYGQWRIQGTLLAYPIAGHHAGLPDWIGGVSGLEARVRKLEWLKEAQVNGMHALLASLRPPTQPPKVDPDHPEDVHLWLRMLFSCLVDADFLDTEAFMDPAKAQQRGQEQPDLAALKARLDAHMAALGARADDSPVNRVRRQVLASCRDGAKLVPGLFSLTVPTGGGKTLASMAFALDHAVRHGKRRVVVVIPYTSIIEQTAEVLAKVFGPGVVLEHHSNLDPARETLAGRLASENWDAPIIVTTNVQFFESLFASRTGACRKLHNLVDSVVVFDEAQMLPSSFLKPILQVLGTLVRQYGVSAVLCTATQPTLQGRIGTQGAVFTGLEGVRELMPDPTGLAVSLRRTALRLHSPDFTSVTWGALAEELAEKDQVLCIVNTRRDCRELHACMPEGTLHLSALMCPEHRSDLIRMIKERLKAGDPIRVISTQLVEAGVDLDFPVVYRALAGLDSMAQAAGRCNREGKLGRLGDVVLFTPPKPAPSGLLLKGEEAARELLRVCPELALSLAPEAFTRYFQTFYGKVNSFDEKDMVGLLVKEAHLAKFQFREAAEAFRLIDEGDQAAIIVRYGPHRERIERLVEALRFAGPSRERLRALQRFTVTLPGRVVQELHRQGDIEEVQGFWVQVADSLYDDRTGLCADAIRFRPDLYTL
ncbi:MAG: CRISPR-associated protein Cas3 [Holophagaceae bacterium]|nr:CRISPR-associated protein Cas3 [Holophagaceae bacterium]